VERIVTPRGRVIEYDETDPSYRADFLLVAAGFADEARRQHDAGVDPDAVDWWRAAAALYWEAGRVAPDEVARQGHLAAALECERQAAALEAE
jgi:hypothetical protein